MVSSAGVPPQALPDALYRSLGVVMKSPKVSIACAMLVAGGSLLAPTAAFAADPPCDAYSGHCPHVEPTKIVKPPTAVQGERVTLPFTGGEIVLMTLVGGGALGAGAAFVVAGRRRRTAAEG
jgi:hypothetical protein